MNTRLSYIVLAVVAFVMAQAAKAADYQPGDTIPEAALVTLDIDRFFTVEPIPDSVFHVMQGRSWPKDCTTPRSSLRYLRCLHKDQGGNTIVGEMVLHQSVANTVLHIFRQLYAADYPIERMRLIDNYDADDNRSMAHNNTSAFCFRRVTGGKGLSRHATGTAIDINPLYNPYVKRGRNTFVVLPAGSKRYTDRSKPFAYKIASGDLCHRLFTENGFRWGGAYRTIKDYQHFEH